MKKWDKQKRNIAVTALVTICICFLTFYSVFSSGQSKPAVTIVSTTASSRPSLEESRQTAEISISSSAVDATSSLQSEEPAATSQEHTASRPKVSAKPPATSSPQKPPESSSPAAVSSSPPASSIQPPESSASEPLQININTATEKELLQIPGILKMKARLILLYREEHGPFQTVEDLMNVEGIGPELFETILPYICV